VAGFGNRKLARRVVGGGANANDSKKKPDLLYISLAMGSEVWLSRQGLKLSFWRLKYGALQNGG